MQYLSICSGDLLNHVQSFDLFEAVVNVKLSLSIHAASVSVEGRITAMNAITLVFENDTMLKSLFIYRFNVLCAIENVLHSSDGKIKID